MRDMSMEQVLNTKLYSNDAQAFTVRDYLMKLLLTVWREEESFSGKRAFGNSGRKYEIYFPLLKKDRTEDEISLQEIEDCDRLINAAIRYMCK